MLHGFLCYGICSSMINYRMDSTEEGTDHSGDIQEQFSFRYNERIASQQKGHYEAEIEEIEPSDSSPSKKLRDFIPIYIPTIETGLMETTHHKKRFFDFLKAHPKDDFFLQFGFMKKARFRVPFVRKIKWRSLINYFKKWIRSPAHIALFIWLILCAIGIVFLFLFMIGALNSVVTGNERRKKWQEVINQILNALFTMMAVYEHPNLFHHLVLVIRWRPNDQVEARQLYSKNGARRPHERAHIFFVVFLLHLTCVAQYVYCSLFWGWSRHDRPDWAVNLTTGIGIASPIIAAVYTLFGPLSKNIDNEPQNGAEEYQNQSTAAEIEIYHRKVVVTTPEWIGGLFDCWDDMTVACLSCFCTFCVFGWNAERLGFGNMYVHIATFVILCIAPIFIFSISALNIDDDAIRIIVAISGGFGCVIGLLYAGYWRSKMRRKFKLPGNSCCCGSPLATDFTQWVFCWCCSLAQEVRTANFYDVEDDGFYTKVTDEEGRTVLVPMPREERVPIVSGRSYSCPPKFEDLDDEKDRECLEVPMSFGKASTYSRVHAMNPPLPPLMQAEDEKGMEV